MKNSKVFKIVAISVTAFFFLITLTATIANSIPFIVSAKKAFIIGDTVSTSTEQLEETAAEGEKMAELVLLEGAVLTKNANNTLPLIRGENPTVSVFGWSSQSMIPGGNGSGRVIRRGSQVGSAPSGQGQEADGNDCYYPEVGLVAVPETNTVSALEMAGINAYTPLTEFYRSYGSTLSPKLGAGRRPNTGLADSGNGGFSGHLKGYDFQLSRIIEPKMTDYGNSLLNGAVAHSKTAIVVISRTSGESNDLPRVQYKGSAAARTDMINYSQIDDDTRHYLEISTEERDMLTWVGENFDNTVVVINSTNTMELGFMDTIPGLDACLIVGGVGIRAATAIPRLLYDHVPEDETSGELSPTGKLVPGVSPSGRTADTYAYDLRTAASWANSGDSDQSPTAIGNMTGAGSPNAPAEFGQRFYTGFTRAEDLYPIGSGSVDKGGSRPNNGNFQGAQGYRYDEYHGITYMDYSEGIYVGYKWYETANEMNYWNTATNYTRFPNSDRKFPANKSGYNAVVQYPFGYGESYTTFNWEVEQALPNPLTDATLDKDGEISIQVKVTNTGTKPGQDVVQAYFTPQWSLTGWDIEKSSVNLAAFAKTQQILQPGESESVILKFSVYDMASYDSHNASKLVPKGGYVLEGGTYTVSLRKNAHSLAIVTSSDPAVSSAEIEYTVPAAGYSFGKDPLNTRADGTTVENRYTGDAAKIENGGDGVPLDGSAELKSVKYMTRRNFQDTFPKLEDPRDMAPAVKALNRFTATTANEWRDRQGNVDAQQASGTDVGLRVWDSTKTIAEYDPNTDNDDWFDKTEPLTRTKMTETGYALGKNYDDPDWATLIGQISISSLTGSNFLSLSDLNIRALSSVGSPELSTKDASNQTNSFRGGVRGVGFPNLTVVAQTFNARLAYRKGLHIGREHNECGIQGWLGPGVNMHRSPLGGRNFEYYSEDSTLSGIMGAEEIKGAKNFGVFVYLKHMAGYEQESNRDAIYIWASEQAFREIYLKPFRLCVLLHADTGHGATGIMSAYGRIGAVYAGGSNATFNSVLRGEWGFRGSVVTDWSDHNEFMSLDHAIRNGGDLGMATSVGRTGETTSNAIRARMRNAAQNVLYTWLNAEYTRANYNPLLDGVSLPGPVERTPNFDWINLIVVLLWVVTIVGGGILMFFAFKKEILALFNKNKPVAATAGADGSAGGLDAESAPPVTEPVSQESAPFAESEPEPAKAAPAESGEPTSKPKPTRAKKPKDE